jgi:hypothetical protein
LQAKAGDVSGGVNATIDELLGQIGDAFAMPYYEVGSKEPRYISTFIIAISGKFTENAREKIVEKMPKGLNGSVYFLDRERLTELVERFWKAKQVCCRTKAWSRSGTTWELCLSSPRPARLQACRSG